jgi:predicted signal transduction protein with EAL and GGDEF domain
VVGQPVDYNGQMITTGLSIGIALSTDGPDGETILKNADLALYRSKADGRGTFRFFEAEMDARAQARRALEIALRQALSKNELEVHYQPQVDIYTDEIVAFEALVRWRHPERGLVSPVEFIPLAEETGIIHRLGEWVLRRACIDAAQWRDSIRISVNVSPAQFRNQDLTHMVASVLKETAFPPHRLELEITESILLKDVEANLRTLHDLKRLGIRIAMDDFGTGYSSLGNLRSFPFDKIKIDRSFVTDLEQNADSAAIVHAILGLGHSLGIATCAEGVETKAQLTYLRREGCSEVQGYYYSKPKPLSEVAAMLDPAPAQLPLVSAEDQAAAATQPAIGSRIGDLVE